MSELKITLIRLQEEGKLQAGDILHHPEKGNCTVIDFTSDLVTRVVTTGGEVLRLTVDWPAGVRLHSRRKNYGPYPIA